jgi:hypothetical protein
MQRDLYCVDQNKNFAGTQKPFAFQICANELASMRTIASVATWHGLSAPTSLAERCRMKLAASHGTRAVVFYGLQRTVREINCEALRALGCRSGAGRSPAHIRVGTRIDSIVQALEAQHVVSLFEARHFPSERLERSLAAHFAHLVCKVACRKHDTCNTLAAGVGSIFNRADKHRCLGVPIQIGLGVAALLAGEHDKGAPPLTARAGAARRRSFAAAIASIFAGVSLA